MNTHVATLGNADVLADSQTQERLIFCVLKHFLLSFTQCCQHLVVLPHMQRLMQPVLFILIWKILGSVSDTIFNYWRIGKTFNFTILCDGLSIKTYILVMFAENLMMTAVPIEVFILPLWLYHLPKWHTCCITCSFCSSQPSISNAAPHFNMMYCVWGSI